VNYILSGLGYVLSVVLNILQFIVLVSVLISWVNADPHNPVVRTVYSITEPLSRPFRALTKNISGPFDFAPLILLLVILFLQNSLVRFLIHRGT